MKPIIYATPGGYDYVWAGNGVFISAENKHLKVRIPVGEFKTRGLDDVQPLLELKHGKLSPTAMEFITRQMMQDTEKENFYVVTWDDPYYKIRRPQQVDTVAGVKYECLDNVVFEFHSHGNIGCFFSSVDDHDEQGLAIYGVIGGMKEYPPAGMLRLGVYGYFHYLQEEEIFGPRIKESESVWPLFHLPETLADIGEKILTHWNQADQDESVGGGD